MKNKIAVLGHRRSMEVMMSVVMHPEEFHYIRDEHSMKGFEYSSYILLIGWQTAYSDPWSVLQDLKTRVR